MQASSFRLKTGDGTEVFVYRWVPEGTPRGVVQIAHGLGEHAARYGRVAEALVEAGYAVYADDHRGHGRTARTPEELGLFAEDDGWQKCVDDLWALNRLIAADHPGLPIILFGHSMGSFMSQSFIIEHGAALAGVALSGSTGKPPAHAAVGLLLIRLLRMLRGRRGYSALVDQMVMGVLNKPFEPARTPFDWLSRDTAEVDKYVADPLCGFRPRLQMYWDFLSAMGRNADPARQARVPKDLPIYIFGGSRDPVMSNVRQLIAAYEAAGIRRLSHRFYQDARHETLNETNRDEVTRDLIAWIDSVAGVPASRAA